MILIQIKNQVLTQKITTKNIPLRKYMNKYQMLIKKSSRVKIKAKMARNKASTKIFKNRALKYQGLNKTHH